jgi:hypothetical protein
MMEKVVTKNNLFDKPGNILNMDDSGVQANNKPVSVITGKVSKGVHILTSGEKGENVTVISCCSIAGQFLPPVLIFKSVNKKHGFGNGLPTGSDVYMNPELSYISTDLFIKWLTELFLKHKPSGKVLLILDGHTSECSSLLLLQTAVENDVIIICLPNHCTHALQTLGKCFFGPLKSYFKKRSSSLDEANPTKENHSISNGAPDRGCLE